MDIDEYLRKETLIKKEITRLKGIYKKVDERKRKTVDGLIEECAFMRVTLTELRRLILEHGVVDEMSQGDYSILRESPYVRTYHTMIQRYTTASEKLLSLLPKNDPAPVTDDGFEDFINEREE